MNGSNKNLMEIFMDKCLHQDSSYFSRTTEEDGSMHYYCGTCGLRDPERPSITLMQVPEGTVLVHPNTCSDIIMNNSHSIKLSSKDNFEFFNGVVQDRLVLIENVLLAKGKEYTRGNDRFSNFKTSGRRQGISPERALNSMRDKHEVSLLDIINDLDIGNLPSEALLEEKIGDSINYLILLEGLIKERLQNAK